MADDWFGEDPFENIFKEFGFFGSQSPRRRRVYREEDVIEGEEEDRFIDFLETEKCIYFIFEIPGYEEKDVSITIKEKKLEINVQKKNTENIPDYLTLKLRKGLSIKKTLPQFLDAKSFKTTCKNGILEVKFDKK